MIGDWSCWKLVWLFFEKSLHLKKFVVDWKLWHCFSGTDQRGFRDFDSNLSGYDWDGGSSFPSKKAQSLVNYVLENLGAFFKVKFFKVKLYFIFILVIGFYIGFVQKSQMFKLH